MKPDDLEFVRGIARHRSVCPNANRMSLPVEEIDRLLTLLIESEAMRQKAEHLRSCLARTLDTGIYCSRCFGSPNIKPWVDRDWIAAVRKEIEG